MAAGGVRDIEDVFGSPYNDTITGNAADNFLSGGPGDDILNGRVATDTLAGGAGSNALIGGGGNDTYIMDETSPVLTPPISSRKMRNVANGMANSAGNNTIDLSSWTNPLTFDLRNRIALDRMATQQTPQLQIELENTTGGPGPATSENVIGSLTQPDVLYGNAAGNLLVGGSGNDTIVGGAGNDTINGNGGMDTLIGGGGINVINGVAGNTNPSTAPNAPVLTSAYEMGGNTIIEGTLTGTPNTTFMLNFYMGPSWSPGGQLGTGVVGDDRQPGLCKFHGHLAGRTLDGTIADGDCGQSDEQHLGILGRCAGREFRRPSGDQHGFQQHPAGWRHDRL